MIRDHNGKSGIVQEHDQAVIERVRFGDNEAFRVLVDRHSQRVYAIACRVTGDPDDARDVAQEVFLKLPGALGGFDHSYRFTTWLYRLTVNLAIDHRRKKRVRQTVPLEEIEESIPASTDPDRPDNQRESRELQEEIERIAEGLTEHQRTVFVLRDLQDFRTPEIAAIMKCRESTVRVHLAAAREHIRKKLIQRYPEQFPGHGKQLKETENRHS